MNLKFCVASFFHKKIIHSEIFTIYGKLYKGAGGLYNLVRTFGLRIYSYFPCPGISPQIPLIGFLCPHKYKGLASLKYMWQIVCGTVEKCITHARGVSGYAPGRSLLYDLF